MTSPHEAFVRRYQQAWKARDETLFDAVWHPDGVLDHPTVGRRISRAEGRTFAANVSAAIPDLTWHLLGWAGQDDTVYLEWECTGTVGDSPFTWRGVDRMRLVDQRIAEEVVYCDTMPLWARLDPTAERPPLVQV